MFNKFNKIHKTKFRNKYIHNNFYVLRVSIKTDNFCITRYIDYLVYEEHVFGRLGEKEGVSIMYLL